MSPEPISLLIVYCVFIIAASVAGGRLSTLVRMTHLRTQLMMSAVGGLMLGIAMLHLLPHAGEQLQSTAATGRATLVGLIAMFLLVRLFHTHDHGVPVEAESLEACDHHGQGHACTHSHGEKGISWTGVFFGLALHTVVDGVALTASLIADSQHGSWLGLAGLGTFLAVMLHKPLDAFAVTSIMNKQGWSTHSQDIANVLFSMACPLGAFGFYFGASSLPGGSTLLGWGLAVSAGFFICIALADLLPEVAFHDHDRGKLTAALLLGVGLAIVIESLPGHDHELEPHNGHFHVTSPESEISETPRTAQ